MHLPLVERFRALYGRPPEIVTRAPGRIEVIGNHTDYNGGTVLGAAIDRAVWVGLASRTDGQRRFASGLTGEPVVLAASDLAKHTGSTAWVNYPLGVLAALPRYHLRSPAGFDFLALSDLPVGAGLSSSAAIELASGLSFLEAVGERPAREILVQVGRYAENHFVGVPCGILDQGVSGFGRRQHLVFIDCRGPTFSTVPLPGEAQFWIFNTHTRHALVDGLYAARHEECMEAARVLGVPWLADVTAVQLAAAASRLPPVAFRRARHVVEEIARVAATTAALRATDLRAVGALLIASHRSSQTLFENSTPELDFLVDQLVALPGVFGARLTGGGFGGAVVALTGRGFTFDRANGVAAAYEKLFGSAPDVLHAHTADGAERLA